MQAYATRLVAPFKGGYSAMSIAQGGFFWDQEGFCTLLKQAIKNGHWRDGYRGEVGSSPGSSCS